MIFGEENGYTYVTVKTEVTIVIHESDDLEALDLPTSHTLLPSPGGAALWGPTSGTSG